MRPLRASPGVDLPEPLESVEEAVGVPGLLPVDGVELGLERDQAFVGLEESAAG
jgi:hypothetical protein